MRDCDHRSSRSYTCTVVHHMARHIWHTIVQGMAVYKLLFTPSKDCNTCLAARTPVAIAPAPSTEQQGTSTTPAPTECVSITHSGHNEHYEEDDSLNWPIVHQGRCKWHEHIRSVYLIRTGDDVPCTVMGESASISSPLVCSPAKKTRSQCGSSKVRRA